MPRHFSPGLLACLFAVLAVAPAHAGVVGNAQSQALVAEGNVLQMQKQFSAARDKYVAAAGADPAASSPVAMQAVVLMTQSQEQALDVEQRNQLRQRAATLAEAALKIDENDVIAQEVLRALYNQAGPQAHQPAPAADKLLEAGEVFFSKGQFEQALALYEQAKALDPLYGQAWVFAGDAYYSMKQWPQAEAQFRQATAIEPLNPQAWRFLADALTMQGKHEQVESVLFSAIAAHPNQPSAWKKMSDFQRGASTPLSSLGLRYGASVAFDPVKKAVDIKLAPTPKDGIEYTFWLAYAMSKSKQQIAAQKAGTVTVPFELELLSWRGAFKIIDELQQTSPDRLPAGPLATLQKLEHDKQLEAAILVLLYQEAYRPQLEAWKLAHPDCVRQFVNLYHLSP